MEKPTVSVVIPTYNRGGCVCRAVDSVLGQTYQDYEIVVVDDGSTDDTRDQLSRYGDRIRYAWKSNGGAGSARNEGLRQARGRYIAWLDSDDVWLPFKLDLQMQVFEQLPDVQLVSSDLSTLTEAGEVVSSYAAEYFHAYRRYGSNLDNIYAQTTTLDCNVEIYGTPVANVKVHTGNIYEKMIWGNLLGTPTIVFERDLVQEVGMFDESLPCFEDYEFHLRMCKVAKVGYIDLPTMIYDSIGPDRLSHDSEETLISQQLLLLRLIRKIAQWDPELLERYPSWYDQCLARSHVNLADCLALRDRPAALTHWRTALRLDPVAALSPRVAARVLLPRVIVQLLCKAKAALTDGNDRD